ncbi:DUF3422 family protein [Zoogloea dura]|jgi:uncharacterized membrane-anchored protein|uniref:DUF3422 domain-containing protein n=1 Tax=Zoogloea dura TaxID=2728840 RepID=A0A848G734_9RHOO|nr:DUF3422 domain-containing protein [Zoogloea dura]NML26745.1 DUF3422 domain-containing protein [Zoogloea dura]
MTLPDHFAEHAQRHALNDEFHARPPVPLESPQLISYLAMHHDGCEPGAALQHLIALGKLLGQPIDAEGSHRLIDFGSFQLRWELHNEFSSYTFFRPVARGEGLDHSTSALAAAPQAWLQSLPGKLIVATHVELRSAAEVTPDSVMDKLSPTGTAMVGAQVADGAAWVFTDFLFEEGFSRFLVIDVSLTRRQAGRTVQRLVEIETYRLMALLAFPVAKEVGKMLGTAEQTLADLMVRTGAARSPDDERSVLADLTSLAAEVEHSVARTTFRFGAARAYHSLVMQRIAELREQRIIGLPTFHEFMERRLLPAMHTCETMARRQEDLSSRVARNSQLLRTRVEVELERQNQELLAQMNRRAKLQLHLQETVEGLSVVAITYYASQLVQYMAKGVKHYIEPFTPEGLTAAAIPVIAGLVAFSMHRMRKHLAAADGGH